MNKKTIIGLAVVLYVLVGLTGFFRFPAFFSVERTVTTYVDNDSDIGVNVSKCRGIPFFYRSCETEAWALREASPST